MEREIISLTTEPWRFCPDPCGEGEGRRFFGDAHPANNWREVGVPSCFDTECPELDGWEGVAWYRRLFHVPPDWRGRRVVLRFGGVNYRASVWLNNVLLGVNTDGFLPFSFSIEKHLRWTGTNTLAVMVDNRHHPGDVPGMHTGWRGYGGIMREVDLECTGQVFMNSFKVDAKPVADGGWLDAHVALDNSSIAVAGIGVELDLIDQAGSVCLVLTGSAGTLQPGGTARVHLQGVLAGAASWSPANPVCYRARARLFSGGKALDEVNLSFGFRSIEATPDGLLLNGSPVYLTGFNRHEDSPRTAMAYDADTVRQDLAAMKEAGANFVRLCHYPHDTRELDMCDELGLLVFSELPLYFWKDADDGRNQQETRTITAMRQLERMIARDRHHPSIIFWSVSNETHETEAAVVEDNASLIRRARELDPTRLCVHVSDRWPKAPHFEEDDVICVNYYPSLSLLERGAFTSEAAAAMWREGLAGLHGAFPGKPILITEFGYCSFAGTEGHAFSESVHAEVLAAEFAAMDASFVCGATVWCWADHPWPAGRFLGGLACSPYGVLTRDRRKLEPFLAVRASFRDRQGVVGVQAGHLPADTLVTMVRDNMGGIPHAAFPDGYGIRCMTRDDIGLWIDIERDAEPHITIADDLFYREFGHDLAAVSRRCFIVTDPRGLGIGTISAWYDRDFHGRDAGRIHWVAIRPSAQGKGLAGAAMSHAMEQLARWHDHCYLVTSTERVPAIALYLKFGFLPDLRPEGARDKWEAFNRHAAHPVLTGFLERPG